MDSLERVCRHRVVHWSMIWRIVVAVIALPSCLGCNCDSYEWSMLSAARGGHSEIVAEYLEEGGDPRLTCFESLAVGPVGIVGEALASRDPATIKIFYPTQADLDRLLHQAINNMAFDDARFYEDTLHAQFSTEREDHIEYLHGYTYVPSRYSELLDYLQIRGVDLDLQDNRGYTPLMGVIRQYGYLRYGLAHDPLTGEIGAQKKEHFDSSVDRYEAQQQIQNVLLLLGRDLDLESSTHNGTTALMIAAEVGSGQLVRALVDRGVNTDRRDNWGRTALDYANLGYGDLDEKSGIRSILSSY